MYDDTKEYPADIVLLDTPIHNADDLIDAGLMDLDIGDDTEQTSEVVLLDTIRLDDSELGFLE